MYVNLLKSKTFKSYPIHIFNSTIGSIFSQTWTLIELADYKRYKLGLKFLPVAESPGLGTAFFPIIGYVRRAFPNFILMELLLKACFYKCNDRESNPRPLVPYVHALPLSYSCSCLQNC